MTNPNLTAIVVIADASGSMSGLRNDTIGSFNTFLNEQKACPGEAMFTLCVFNDTSRLVHDFVKIASVEKLTIKTYSPSGNTALLDAVGSTIDSVGRRLASMSEEERPSKVVVLIITDGQENQSRRYTRAQIKEMVEHQTSVYSWQFVFIGANVDAFHEGVSLGVSAANSYGYMPSAVGTRSLYGAVSSNMTSYRSSNSSAPVSNFMGQSGTTTVSGGIIVDNTVPTPVNPTVPTTVAPVDTPKTDTTSDTK